MLLLFSALCVHVLQLKKLTEAMYPFSARIYAADLLSVSEKLAVLHATDTSVDKAVPHRSKSLNWLLPTLIPTSLTPFISLKKNTNWLTIVHITLVTGCTTSVMIDY